MVLLNGVVVLTYFYSFTGRRYFVTQSESAKKAEKTSNIQIDDGNSTPSLNQHTGHLSYYDRVLNELEAPLPFSVSNDAKYVDRTL